SKYLEELSAIKKQVVTLDLGRMPVKDAELKTIAQFENLHTLNLNFTDVTGSTLKELAGLKFLKMISLAGAPINADAIKQISALKSLTKITLWDTGLTGAQLQDLQAHNKKVEFVKSFKDDGKPIKLNVPQVKNTALVFAQSIPLELSHSIKGVQIRYTTDGTDPDSSKSPIFKPGVALTKNTSVKIKAYKPGWLSSDVVQFNVFKSTFMPDSVSYLQPPVPKYSADGAKSLFDKDLGGTNFGNGKWIAAQKPIEIYMQFAKPTDLHIVTINCLRIVGTQIFLPVGIEVWGGADKDHLKLLSNVIPPPVQKADKDMTIGIDCKLNTAKPISCLKITVKNIRKLPKWDPVKSTPEWIFMDEIFLN
ncbi:MAG: FN3 associated domain-containing protein, partial [Mucilaginibacter sp.]